MPSRLDILPNALHAGLMLQNVAFVVLNRFPSFEFGVVCEIFGIDRTDDGLPAYDFAVVAGEEGRLVSEHGLALTDPADLDRLAEADLVVVSAIDQQCPGAQRVHGRVRAGGRRAAGRPAVHDALDARR